MKINTLTVNGNTYTLQDPQAAVIDDTAVGEGAWSSRKIVQLLCPSATLTGERVTCRPIPGVPLESVTTCLTAPTKDLLADRAWKQAENWQYDEMNAWYYYLLSLPQGQYTVNYKTNDYASASLYTADAEGALVESFHLFDGSNQLETVTLHTAQVPYTGYLAVVIHWPTPPADITDVLEVIHTGDLSAHQETELTLTAGEQTYTVQLEQPVAALEGGSYHWTEGKLTDAQGTVLQETQPVQILPAGEMTLAGSVGILQVTSKVSVEDYLAGGIS